MTKQSMVSLVITIAMVLGATAIAAPATATSWAAEDEVPAAGTEAGERYREGRAALNRGDWDRARDLFEEVRETDDSATSAATYWEAYAAYKGGDADDALELIRELRREHPDSAWIDDAEALQLEIRGPRSADRSEDQELKLMALNALALGDPDEAVPSIVRFYENTDDPELKKRALYVLAQAGSSEAVAYLSEIARTGDTEQERLQAIKYLGIFGGDGHLEELERIYDSGTFEVKKSILHAYMVADATDRLLRAARSESDTELRKQAVHWLGVSDATEDLWVLYQEESDAEVQEQILHALFLGDDVDRMLEVATTSDSEARREKAVHYLGLMDANDALWSIFQSDPSMEVRKQILHSLFLADDTEHLAIVATGAEYDLELRKSALHSLGLVDGQEAREMLIEVYRGGEEELAEQALHGLFLQDAAPEMVDLYRDETDVERKKKILRYLGLMDTPEARKVLMEVLDG